MNASSDDAPPDVPVPDELIWNALLREFLKHRLSATINSDDLEHDPKHI
jgi:hypothetical protein